MSGSRKTRGRSEGAPALPGRPPSSYDHDEADATDEGRGRGTKGPSTSSPPLPAELDWLPSCQRFGLAPAPGRLGPEAASASEAERTSCSAGEGGRTGPAEEVELQRDERPLEISKGEPCGPPW